jgi:hypothetical protein
MRQFTLTHFVVQPVERQPKPHSESGLTGDRPSMPKIGSGDGKNSISANVEPHGGLGAAIAPFKIGKNLMNHNKRSQLLPLQHRIQSIKRHPIQIPDN